MASLYRRGKIFWVKLGHPRGGEQLRFSLDTVDGARARLLARMVEGYFDLKQPEFQGIELPAKILEFLGQSANDGTGKADASIVPCSNAPATSQPRVPIEEALAEYAAFVKAENAPRHAANKMAQLRGFFGEGLLGVADGKVIFKGSCLEDVRVGDVRRFIDDLPVVAKTRRHYRETYHHLFEVAMKYGFFLPMNFRYPNPMSALPGYASKNQMIRFLTPAQKEKLFAVLEPRPSVHAAARLMIGAGLRRAEALWLPKSAISADLTYMSIVNQVDADRDLESTLKTGSRPVSILPSLRKFLERYLPTLTGEWLVPSPTGKQWHGDNFGDAHREILRSHGLTHTCLEYRHTFATERAREGWSLFRIAKQMGNSTAVAERYYAAYVNPDQDQSGL